MREHAPQEYGRKNKDLVEFFHAWLRTTVSYATDSLGQRDEDGFRKPENFEVFYTENGVGCRRLDKESYESLRRTHFFTEYPQGTKVEFDDEKLEIKLTVDSLDS